MGNGDHMSIIIVVEIFHVKSLQYIYRFHCMCMLLRINFCLCLKLLENNGIRTKRIIGARGRIIILRGMNNTGQKKSVLPQDS